MHPAPVKWLMYAPCAGTHVLSPHDPELDTLKVAVTDCAALIVTVHAPVPEHPQPLQPANVEPDAADAVNTDIDTRFDTPPR